MSLNPRMRVLKNFGALSLGRTLGDVLTFLLFVVLSRIYGEEGTGQYSIAMALTGFFAVGVDFGLYSFAIREMNLPENRSPEGRRRLLGQVFGLRLILGVGAIIVLALLLPHLSVTGSTSTIILWIGIYQVFYLLFDIFMTPFVAEEQMTVASGFELGLRGVIALAAVGLALQGADLETVVAVFPVATLAIGVIGLGVALHRFGRPTPAELFGSIRQTMQSSKDFALYVFLRQLASRADIILLGFFLGAISAGVYNAAYRIVFMFIFLPYFAGISLLPQATRLFESEDPSFGPLLSQSVNAILILAVPLAAGLWTIAPELIALFYGSEQFHDSVWILRWLSGLVFLAFLKLILGTFLTASQRQPERVRGQWIAAIVNVVGNLILIPTIGLIGAAITTLVAEAGAVIYYWYRLRGFVPTLGFPVFLIPTAFGSAVFVVLFGWLWHPPLLVVVLLSAAIYAGLVFLSPAVRRQGIPFLLSLRSRTEQ